MLVAKKWALKYAVNAACTILRVRNSFFSIPSSTRRIIKLSLTTNVVDDFVFTQIALVNACHVTQVDQIIMAKRAGGPKPRDTSGGMDQDDD